MQWFVTQQKGTGAYPFSKETSGFILFLLFDDQDLKQVNDHLLVH